MTTTINTTSKIFGITPAIIKTVEKKTIEEVCQEFAKKEQSLFDLFRGLVWKCRDNDDRADWQVVQGHWNVFKCNASTFRTYRTRHLEQVVVACKGDKEKTAIELHNNGLDKGDIQKALIKLENAQKDEAGKKGATLPDAGKPDAGKPDAGKPDAGEFDVLLNAAQVDREFIESLDKKEFIGLLDIMMQAQSSWFKGWLETYGVYKAMVQAVQLADKRCHKVLAERDKLQAMVEKLRGQIEAKPAKSSKSK